MKSLRIGDLRRREDYQNAQPERRTRPRPDLPDGPATGGRCLPAHHLPLRTATGGRVCQPITCPTGQQLVGSTCQPITCPTGQQLVGNLCQPIICTGGQVLVGNLCTCPGGQVFIGAGCQCPAGTIDYAGACKTPSIVPGTGSGTVIYFPVTEELRQPLQVLVNSIIDTVDPSLFRTSGSPAGALLMDSNPRRTIAIKLTLALLVFLAPIFPAWGAEPAGTVTHLSGPLMAKKADGSVRRCTSIPRWKRGMC